MARNQATVPVNEASAVLGYTPRDGRDDGRFLTQDTYWVTQDGEAQAIAGMPAGYAAIAAAFLLDRAHEMQWFAEVFYPATSAWDPDRAAEDFVRSSVLYAALQGRAVQAG